MENFASSAVYSIEKQIEKEFSMFEEEKEILKRICRKSNVERQNALELELSSRNISYENLDDMAIIVPAKTAEKIVLCAHFDAVEGSFGYNDNGMALVTALKMIDSLPSFVEVVFTNLEERRALGAAYYVEHNRALIKGCINLDVVGCFDAVYMDSMNFSAARSLTSCKQGRMPPSDAYAFAFRGIPSVCFSSGPAHAQFHDGIDKICSTIHNNKYDNRFELLNFEMIFKVAEEVRKVVTLMKEVA